MNYKVTSESTTSLIYLGVRLFVDEEGSAHTTMHDRAVEYPIQVDRYPEATTVANPAQLGGVIMGRLVSAQRLCSRLDLFQDAVAGVFNHAHRRGYSRRLLHSVWTRFLTTYWDAASVSLRELRAWFHRAWKHIIAGTSERHPNSGDSTTIPSTEVAKSHKQSSETRKPPSKHSGASTGHDLFRSYPAKERRRSMSPPPTAAHAENALAKWAQAAQQQNAQTNLQGRQAVHQGDKGKDPQQQHKNVDAEGNSAVGLDFDVPLPQPPQPPLHHGHQSGVGSPAASSSSTTV